MNDFEVPEGIDVLRVFCGPDGRHGNALGVVRDGRRYPGNESRQALARKLGFSETVFVDDPERGTVDIRTPGCGCRSRGTRSSARPGCSTWRCWNCPWGT